MAKHTPREDQQNLPQTDEKNERVHRAAKMYAKRRDERMAANEVEKEAHEKLLETMVEEGLDTYSYADLDVTINNSKKCRVVIGGDRKTGEDSEDE
jgi:nucleosome binding factor SPN SPT16 subunit